MGRGFRVSLVFVAVVVGGPIHPASPCDGARIYGETEFRGQGLPIPGNLPDLADWGMDDDGESILVPGGCRMVLFTEKRYRGKRLEIVGPAYSTDLAPGEWSDRISSVKVYRTRRPTMPAIRGSELNWGKTGEKIVRTPAAAGREARAQPAANGLSTTTNGAQ